MLDGPFTESKELIAGYVIVRADSPDDAMRWATRYVDAVECAEVDVRALASSRTDSASLEVGAPPDAIHAAFADSAKLMRWLAGEMIMTWSLGPTAVGTKVTVTAENVPSGISQADHDAGLRSSLENLASFVS